MNASTKNSPTSAAAETQKEFKRFMKLHKLSSLKAVRQIPTAELLKMEGFGYRQLIEVVLNHGMKSI